MDKRLIVEFLPSPAFALGDAIGGIFTGAGLSAFAAWHSAGHLPPIWTFLFEAM